MDIVERAAGRFGDHPALVAEDKTISFRELEKETSRIAGALDRQDIRNGKTAALCMPNSPELVLLLLALLRTGAVAAPLNHRFPAERLQTMLDSLNPSVLVGTEVLTEALDFPVRLTPGKILSEAERATIEPQFNSSTAQQFNTPVTVIHTSSSSGVAKAALHSFGNHYHSALGSNENLPFCPGDCWLLSLPLFHIGGYALLFRSLLGGGALAAADPGTPTAEALQRFDITHLSLVPTQLYRLLRNDASRKRLRRAKAVLLGGSAVEPALLQDAAKAGIPVYLSYGSTEMSSQVATTGGAVPADAVTAGRVLPYRELSIGAFDEILVKGPCLFRGYLSPDGPRLETGEAGWFHTGDTGALSPDGELRVTGRMDNMFISGGENIHPEEIERALCDIAGIRRALVIPAPDSEYGVRPKAFIEASDDAPGDEDILSRLRNGIGSIKTPASVNRVGEWRLLPGTEKIDRAYYLRRR
ncbi:o-succinylbenzoate--CoA ligase [Prosthecochloris sp. GSB1]|uniref:o-succinylbenzoate--CoA ligase n=1 Tax=Prosthecochloris sp. GSB1 TaxID=281093 RepID=UPI000B8CA1A1|nr:o-succinylbenzoate--CoA ligase [Prosthecochloris sp. GSB1]ASQ91202.1 o-succinylbenzoate--CoA ligase [Prosthecochloris sp. GSB1]